MLAVVAQFLCFRDYKRLAASCKWFHLHFPSRPSLRFWAFVDSWNMTKIRRSNTHSLPFCLNYWDACSVKAFRYLAQDQALWSELSRLGTAIARRYPRAMHCFDNALVKAASQFNNFRLLQRLLRSPVVDPASDNNYAIRKAALYGSYHAVVLLLKDARVDPTAIQNQALRNACKPSPLVFSLEKTLPSDSGFFYGFSYKSFQQWPDGPSSATKSSRLKPSLSQKQHWNRMFYALATACELINDPRVDVDDMDGQAIVNAASIGFSAVVAKLLDRGANPSLDGNLALVVACENGALECVELLASDPRVDVLARHGKAVEDAIRNGHVQIIEFLVGLYPRIDIWRAGGCLDFVRIAKATGQEECLRVLKRDRASRALDRFKGRIQHISLRPCKVM
ncbi:hypothetical protein HDU91_006949 [Kappamyces sp. JEL0680]|nr:hypothetical protein HDU91_006949 [Kappamyces sp. JEL0680]